MGSTKILERAISIFLTKSIRETTEVSKHATVFSCHMLVIPPNLESCLWESYDFFIKDIFLTIRVGKKMSLFKSYHLLASRKL